MLIILKSFSDKCLLFKKPLNYTIGSVYLYSFLFMFTVVLSEKWIAGSLREAVIDRFVHKERIKFCCT